MFKVPSWFMMFIHTHSFGIWVMLYLDIFTKTMLFLFDWNFNGSYFFRIFRIWIVHSYFSKKSNLMKLLLHNFLTGIVNLLGDKSHHFKAIQNAILCKKDVDCYSRFLICILDANIDVFCLEEKTKHNWHMMIIALIIRFKDNNVISW